MRKWMKELDRNKRDEVHELDFLLGKRINQQEYNEIKAEIKENVLFCSYTRKEFVKKYPKMVKYKKK